MIVETLVLLIILFLTVRWFLRGLKVRYYGNKHVFITGCDTGFGNLLAKRLDTLGFRVYAGCLTAKGMDDLKATCSKYLTTVEIDVSKETSIQKARHDVERKLPKGKGLWAIVNNAGVPGSIGPIEWLPASEFRRTIEINLFGVIFVTKEFLPLVRREKSGRIVNMSSICGRLAVATGPYVASEFGVEGFSDQLRYELYRSGISVHIIEPGYFRTGIVDEEAIRTDLHATFEQAPREVQKYYGEIYRDETVEKNSKLLTTIMSPKINKVVEAYEHAVTSRFPKTRYVIGWDAQIPFRILWNLPEWMTGFIVSRTMSTPEGAKI
ncbi:short-chain dehydrogenase/reductase family 9C member 7-like [Mercenaria mercenaria]|uniref:short-chain dehydrogenase/reductase family 9C member 7-like n=1 Tax=Mercenaria mercenaria TaxID=6596 RepID=UPI00234ED78B|nr:short-chain dehydrogenase/reductase family 9C member 7-like [Mercenaria mercenaria]